MIVTHFPKAPELIIYDNACNLSEFCLGREPTFFKSTRFLVDGLHYSGHVNCNPAYDMRTYPLFSDIVSTTAENCNRRLYKIRIGPQFMKAESLVAVMLYWVFRYNREIHAGKKHNGLFIIDTKDFSIEIVINDISEGELDSGYVVGEMIGQIVSDTDSDHTDGDSITEEELFSDSNPSDNSDSADDSDMDK